MPHNKYKENKNVYLSMMINGSNRDSDVMSLALVCENQGLYIERTDFDLKKSIKNDVAKKIQSMMRMMDKDESYKETFHFAEEDQYLTELKDHDYKLKIEIGEWLLKQSNGGDYKLNIWVDNPLSWFFFLELGMSFEGYAPDIPEYINPYPMDMNTLSALFLGGRTIQDMYPNAPELVEYNSYGRVQFIQDLVERVFSTLIDPAKEKSGDNK